MEPFEIVADRATQTLFVTLRGFWDLATVNRYGAALLIQSAGLDPARARWLIDASDFGVQSSEVATAMAQRLGDGRLKTPPLVAVVQPSAVGAMQARRISPPVAHRFFATLAEARGALDLPPA